MYSISASARAVWHSGHQWTGLEAFIDVAFQGHFSEHLNLPRLESGKQRHIRVLPVPQDAQTLELIPLILHIPEGEFPAELPQGQRFERGKVPPGLGAGLEFDGQAMGVETGHVRRFIARDIAVPQNDILEDLGSWPVPIWISPLA